MLTRLTVDQVRHVADLARRAADAHTRLVGGRNRIDLGEQPQERGSRNPSDIDTLNVLEDAGSPEIETLKRAIGGLPEDMRHELKALMLVGRGDYAAAEWDAAMDYAGRTPATADVDFLAERLTLSDYLNKGLYQLKCL